MLNAAAFLLSGSDPSEYKEFIDLLKDNIIQVNIYSDKDSFLSSINGFSSQNSKTSSVAVIFIEYDLYHGISFCIKGLLEKSECILVLFSSKDVELDENPDNVFEYVYTKHFNSAFFINKLKREIDSKNEISFLRNEAREFYEIGKSLSSEKDTVKLLDMIVTSSMKLTSSDAATIYLVIDKDSYNWTSIKNNDYRYKSLKFVIAKNSSMDVNLETFISPITKESIFGYLVITGETVRIDDAYSLSPDLDYRHNNSFDLHTGYVTKSILATPIKDHEGNILGVIQLINKKKFPDEKIDFKNKDALSRIITYDYKDELIMNSLAGHAAVALENNLLYREMKNLLDGYKRQNTELEALSKKILIAHEEERKRIAREIHDGPAQSVVNLSLRVELAKKLLQNSMYEKCVDELNSLNEAIKSTSTEIRTLLYDLKPSYLDVGIITALKNRFSSFEESSGVKVAFNFSGNESKIEYYLASTLYRMIQESLSNIYKHAKAKNVTVNFSITDNMVYVTITDDGVGFDVEAQSKKSQDLKGGFGLGGLQERAELVKGKVKITSAPGKGTCVSICIPI
ncbi:MAG: GAF domain-containing sensor histidine kinase [Clostridium sp.]|nr:GAF domain-containing sensor histidine kinase [Clostridium sp.]